MENIFITAYGQAMFKLNPQIKAGIEGKYQFQVGQGGNPEQHVAYFPNQKNWLAGCMVAYTPTNWNISANYLHIGGEGRFLFPREWVREQFFATIPRGRLEGMGPSDILVGKVKGTWGNRFSSEVALAKTWLPAPNTSMAMSLTGSERLTCITVPKNLCCKAQLSPAVCPPKFTQY